MRTKPLSTVALATSPPDWVGILGSTILGE